MGITLERANNVEQFFFSSTVYRNIAVAIFSVRRNISILMGNVNVVTNAVPMMTNVQSILVLVQSLNMIFSRKMGFHMN
jgi:hypothetical protein